MQTTDAHNARHSVCHRHQRGMQRRGHSPNHLVAHYGRQSKCGYARGESGRRVQSQSCWFFFVFCFFVFFLFVKRAKEKVTMQSNVRPITSFCFGGGDLPRAPPKAPVVKVVSLTADQYGSLAASAGFSAASRVFSAALAIAAGITAGLGAGHIGLPSCRTRAPLTT